jgi:GNAT superfamily N-acetyltransferase
VRLRFAAADTAALDLVERVMGSAEFGGIREEQPLAFESRFGGLQVSVEEETSESRVLSTCTLLVRDVVTPQACFRIGLIGAVATEPDSRGRGLATSALAAAEEELERRGCMISLLWADDSKFYERRGYQPVGTEVDWLLTPELLSALPGPGRVRPARQCDGPALHALYCAHPERVLRSLDETRAMLATPGMSVLAHVASDVARADAPTAYACLGRGRDLAGVVHEWGGPVEEVLALLHAHAARRPGVNLFLMAPPSAEELASRLRAGGAAHRVGYLGMAKLLRVDLACDLLVGSARGRSPAVHLASGDGVRLVGPGGEVSLDRSGLLDALMAPRGERRAVTLLEARTGLEFPRLPLTPFVWGLDSI